MFNNVALDVVIGLVFIYLLYSLLASVIQEIIATHFDFRAKILEKAILRMLNDGQSDKQPWKDRLSGYMTLLRRASQVKGKKFAEAFYNHPLVKCLAEDTWHSKPSYLRAENFSKVVVDLLHGVEADLHGVNILRIKEALAEGKLKLDAFTETPISPDPANSTDGKHIEEETRRFLQSLLSEAQGDVNKFKLSLEKWFDSTMERASGWYKKYTQVGLLFVGLIIAVVFNVDSLVIVKKLSRDPKLREQVVQAAIVYTKENPELNKVSSPDSDIIQKRKALIKSADSLIKNDINNVNKLMNLGWEHGFPNLDESQNNFFKALLGWILTALALSLGAPFWFDLLSKLVKLRGAGGRSEGTSPAQGSVSVQPVITINNNNPGEEAVG
ncbi:MAG: hypothetical protein ACM3H8_10485 [Sphingobacteriales bacterium]